MQEYDVALKLLLQGSATLTVRELTGTAVTKWLNVELPSARNLRLDLLGETADGGRLYGRLPRQVVLYVGEPELRMQTALRAPGVSFEYRLIDIRTLDGERLLESADGGDNLIAILARLRDDKWAVYKILERIAGLAAAERETLLSQLTILSGLRHWRHEKCRYSGTRVVQSGATRRPTDDPSPAN